MAIFIENLLIPLAIIIQTDLLRGFLFAILWEGLRGRKNLRIPDVW
jgi:hypothetical protein